MTMRYMLGAYWPARKESVEECASRLHAFLAQLTASDSALVTWYERAQSRKRALRKSADTGDRNYLQSLLNQGRNRRDVGHTVIDELGFHVGLWNGGDARSEAGLSVTCGLYWVSPTPNASMSNCVVLHLPTDLGELNQTERMAHLLAATARAWEPDWAGVMSNESMKARGFDASAPFVDWMVYVPRQIRGVPPPSSVIALKGLGSLITVHPTPPLNDPEEAPRVRKIEAVLFG